MEIVFNSYMGYLDWRDAILETALDGDEECADLLVRVGVNPKIIKRNYSVELRYIIDGFVKLRYVYGDDGDSARVEVYIELQERDEDDEEDLYEEDNQELIVFIKAYGGI